MISCGVLAAAHPKKGRTFCAQDVVMSAIDNMLRLAAVASVPFVQAATANTGVHARNADGVTGLMTAAAAGNVDVVRWFLEQGVDVDAGDKSGFTALIAASGRGQVHVIKLLKDCAKPNLKTHDNQAAIHLAVRHNQLRTIRTLATMPGVDLNIPNQHGRTALHIAAAHGFLPIVRFLVKHPRVNLQAVDVEGFNALHLATGGHQTEVVKFLEAAGFDLNALCGRRTSALFIACAVGCLELVKDLFGRTKFSVDEDGDTELHVAVRHSHILEYVLAQKKHALDAVTNDGSTALHRAVHEGMTSMDVVQALVAAKAPLDAKDHLGCTPFFKACHHGGVQVVRFLLQAKSNPHELDRDGFTALHAASQNGRVPVMNYLVHDVGLALESQNPHGYTPIMCALRFTKKKAVKWLVSQGVDLHVRSQFGTAIELARLFENTSDDARKLSEWLSRPCGRPECVVRGSKKCSGCCKVRYCSTACQRLHRSDHEPLCFISL